MNEQQNFDPRDKELQTGRQVGRRGKYVNQATLVNIS